MSAKKIHLVAIVLLLISTGLKAQVQPVELLVLYDNHQFDDKTHADFGFACLVIHNNDTLLFDTGARKDILFSNMEALHVNPRSIKTLVISHHHGDHTGNIFPLLEANPHMRVYLPSSLKGSFEKMVRKYGAETIIEKNTREIADDIYLSREMGFQTPEQCLVIKSSKGLLILSACSHPGIDRVVKNVAEYFKQNVYMVMGGFHLEDYYEDEIIDIIRTFRKYGVQKVVPGHCTGDLAKSLFREVYQNDYCECGTGMSLLY